jgi:glycosyltransferase involved in cell wall biosynthesis
VAPDEVIVVDNNSSDATAAIASKYPFVKLIKESKQGIVFARNAGYNAARGEIIGRIDVDTLLPANWVAHLQEFYADSQHPNSAWVGPNLFYNVRFPKILCWAMWPIGFGINRLLIHTNTLWGSNMALLKSQWESVKATTCTDNSIHEDLDLAIHLYKEQNVKTYFDRQMVVWATFHPLDFRTRETWDYLQRWPRTLRKHHNPGWLVAELIGVGLIYCLIPPNMFIEWVARQFGKPLAYDAEQTARKPDQ